MFPFSLPRTLSALRFASFLSLVISIYIAMAIMIVCLTNNNPLITPDLNKSFRIAISNFNINTLGVFNSLPIVMFSYMYQTNIPMLYVELEKKDLKDMWNVMLYGTVGVTISYLMAGIFGYVTWAANPLCDTIMN